MKRKELQKKLKKLGYCLLRNGGNHDVWSNGKRKIWVPRHNEISEGTANSILKDAERNK